MHVCVLRKFAENKTLNVQWMKQFCPAYSLQGGLKCGHGRVLPGRSGSKRVSRSVLLRCLMPAQSAILKSPMGRCDRGCVLVNVWQLMRYPLTLVPTPAGVIDRASLKPHKITDVCLPDGPCRPASSVKSCQIHFTKRQIILMFWIARIGRMVMVAESECKAKHYHQHHRYLIFIW